MFLRLAGATRRVRDVIVSLASTRVEHRARDLPLITTAQSKKPRAFVFYLSITFPLSIMTIILASPIHRLSFLDDVIELTQNSEMQYALSRKSIQVMKKEMRTDMYLQC